MLLVWKLKSDDDGKEVGRQRFEFWFQNSFSKIIRGTCINCQTQGPPIYYRRLPGSPINFGIHEIFRRDWMNKENTLNQDYSLYWYYDDAFNRRSNWGKQCSNQSQLDANLTNDGFPGNCINIGGNDYVFNDSQKWQIDILDVKLPTTSQGK